jgi:hypothetical protein
MAPLTAALRALRLVIATSAKEFSYLLDQTYADRMLQSKV